MLEKDLIDACFGAPTVAGVLEALGARAGNSRFAREAAAAIQTKSPTSLAIALRQMQIGGSLTMDEAMRAEYRIVSRLCWGHDFYEGVRALIIDKDNAPKWSPAAIADVGEHEINAMFAPLADNELPDG